MPYDVLIQCPVTLGVSNGFEPNSLFKEIKSTFAYQTLNGKEQNWILGFQITCDESLIRYDEHTVVVEEVGL